MGEHVRTSLRGASMIFAFKGMARILLLLQQAKGLEVRRMGVRRDINGRCMMYTITKLPGYSCRLLVATSGRSGWQSW